MHLSVNIGSSKKKMSPVAYLVSETKNACLSLSSSDEEGEDGGDPDLHQCGHCKLMFNNLTKYITHKIQKECWIERNADEEEITWSPDRNEMSSPDCSNKEEIEEDNNEQQHNIDVKSLHHDLQKRKLRKGYVRRIKPAEMRAEDDDASLNVFPPEGEDMVMMPAEHDHIEGNDDPQVSYNEKKEENVDFNKSEFLSIDSNNDSVKLRGSYASSRKPYALYTGSECKPDQSRPAEHSQSMKKTDLSKSKHPYNDLMEQTRNVRPYGIPNSNMNSKYDRIPTNLPQIMSTRGSPRQDNTYGRRQIPRERPYPGDQHYHGERVYPNDRIYSSNNRQYPVERQYADRPYHEDRLYPTNRSRPSDRPYANDYDRYGEEYGHPKYYPPQEANTASTWTSNYVDRPSTSQAKGDDVKSKNSELRSKYNSDLPYDGYRTMANLKNLDEITNDSSAKSPTEKEANIKNDVGAALSEVVDSLKRDDDQNDENTPKVSLLEPPELVRVKSVEGEKMNFNKPPPSLEKCGADYVNDKPLKVEEGESRDCLNSTMENPSSEAANLNESQDTEASPAGLDLSSPEKESNSPHDSNHSHDAEDFTLEQNPREEPPGMHLPPHRRLSESTVERLITVPASVGSDASWKHAKQVYSCPLCAKVFPFKSKLQRHVLVHTGIKPYKCTVCGRGFTQQIDLQRHLTRHTGEKPFKCHLCTAQFIRADNLRKHCKDSHYVNIEEPIRKRRRKTTGSDTVLPSLEVAIALAFSETERNGGRVLGRAVSRTNPRNPAVSRNLNHPEDSNQRNDNPSFRTGYPPDIFPRQNIRYQLAGKMDGQYPSQMGGKFHGKMEAQYSSKRDPGMDCNQPYMTNRRDGPSYPPGEPPRYYQNAPPGGYGMRSDYDRDPQDYYQQRDRERQGGELRMPPDHKFNDQRYQMGYQSMPVEPRGPGYIQRRSGEEEFNHIGNEIEYQGRRVNVDHKTLPRKFELNDEFQDGPIENRVPLDDPSRYGDGGAYIGFAAPQNEKEDIMVRSNRDQSSEFNSRAAYLTKQKGPHKLQQHASAPFLQSDADKEDHRLAFRDKPSFVYGDYGPLVPNRSPDVSHGQVDSRGQADSNYDYEGNYAFNKSLPGSDMVADPGEYISMATAKENETETLSTSHEQDIKPPNEEIECVKSEKLAPSQTDMFVYEEDIPVVTRSDDLAVIAEET